MHLFHQFVTWYMAQVNHIGWTAYVFFGMLIESTVLPLPSEIVMPPAGMNATGKLNLIWLIFAGTAGSLCGSWINYALGYFLGRPFFEKYGSYVLVGPRHLAKLDAFWARRGEGSTFIARFVPGIRHLISIPAGLLRMNFWKFTLFTALGAGGWNIVLGIVGYMLRGWTMEQFENQLNGDMKPYVIAGIVLLIGGYILKLKFWNPKHGRA